MSLQQLREKIVTEVPISDLIQRYGIHLTKKSTGHVGVCPFHQDSNPSMSVSDDKKIYRCFACGAGHSHFDFVMNLNSLSFVEALQDICEKFGIDFDSYTDKKEKPQKFIFAEKLLKAASEIYFKIGQQSKPQAYLDFMKNRELPANIVTDYRLGFAPKKNTIVDYITSLPPNNRKAVLEVALEIGIIKTDEKSNAHYDTFRDRIMFPIWDHFGKVIGFTSRAIHDYQKAKYMNSKESFIFNKRNLLYGLHFAKPTIRKRDYVLLVEGNMDQVAMFKKGFENTVAIQGTALGDNSLRTLKALTKNIILSLDTDNAGYEAGKRINKQFLEAGIVPKYIEFSPVKDPDDFLMEYGSLEMQKKIDEARPFVDIQFEKLIPKEPIELLDKKLEILEQGFEILAPLQTNLLATERVVKWSSKIGLMSSPEQIIENYTQFLKGVKPTHSAATKNTEPDPNEPPPGYFEEQEIIQNATPMFSANEMPTKDSEISKPEETLLITLIEYPNCLEYDQLSDLLDFMDSDRVKEYILNLQKLIFEIDQKEFKNFALKTAEEFGLEEIVRRGITRSGSIELDQERAKKFIVDLEKKLIKEKLKEKKNLLKLSRSSCNTEEELSSLMKEIHEIEKKLYNL